MEMKQLSNETVAELVKTVPFAIVATRKQTAKCWPSTTKVTVVKFVSIMRPLYQSRWNSFS